MVVAIEMINSEVVGIKLQDPVLSSASRVSLVLLGQLLVAVGL